MKKKILIIMLLAVTLQVLLFANVIAADVDDPIGPKAIIKPIVSAEI